MPLLAHIHTVLEFIEFGGAPAIILGAIGAVVGYLSADDRDRGEGATGGATIGAGIGFVLGVSSGAAVPT
jgi:hypothetical protein